MANSFVRYTGNGTTTTYAIPFSYRDTADLSATVAGVNVTAYTLDAAGTNLTFTTAPANGSAIEIRRTTSQTTKLVDYVSGSVLTENDLDTDSDQAFFMSQEAIDDANDVISLDNVDFQWDTQNKRLKNVADPTAAQDAATKNYLENTWLSPADKTALTTVNANIANINAVNANETNINSVNSNETNINTVATNIGSVNTVATDIAKVITVANDLAEAVSEVETVADDLNEATSEIDTVSNNIANVNTVGTNIANVNTVAGISSNVTTVAGNNANVSTVAGISGNVTTVAGISSDVTSVANDATDIGTVATDIANVNTVATDIANVNSVAGNSTNINAVAGNETNINAVNSNSSNINTVAGINANVTTVANDGTDIGTVATNIANVNTVAGNNANINTVAGNNSNITTVAGISSNVTTVAGISSDVTAVVADATDIGTVATDLTGSDNIGTVAGSIANVNLTGGSIANVNTVGSNIGTVNEFGERYRVSATAPTTSLDVGDLYYDTATDAMKVYGSSGWQNAGSSVNGTSQRYNYTATNAQTTFTGSDNNGNTLTYDAGYIDVYLNGVKLLNGTDVTVTSGSSVVLASGATTGDVVDIVAYGTFSVASLNADNLDSGTVPTARLSGAYTGITQTGTLSSLNVDASAGTGVIGITLDNGTVSTSKDSASFRSQFTMYNTTGQVARFDTANDDFYLKFAGDLAFQSTAGSEYMRIDSSGNVLVGKTADSSATVGFQARQDGFIAATRASAQPLILNRTTNDGIIADFRKDNTNVGSITCAQGRLAIGNGDTGLKFGDSDNAVMPFNVDTNANRDAEVDLGYNSVRFKDLYLSGGAYLGGTGTANKLDDYEEGTWTPVYKTSGTNYPSITYDAFTGGKYTKIGRLVSIQATLRTDAVDSTGVTGAIQIGGLPFAAAGNTTASQRDGISAVSLVDQSGWLSGNTPNTGGVSGSAITLGQLYSSSSNVNTILATNLQTGGNANRINIQAVYMTA